MAIEYCAGLVNYIGIDIACSAVSYVSGARSGIWIKTLCSDKSRECLQMTVHSGSIKAMFPAIYTQ